MIYSASLHTFEIDRPEVALEELQSQLNEKITLRRNSAAIIQCDPEYIDSGVAALVCRELPFPVVGCTTAAQATNDAVGELMLTLLVLTSDDVEFETAHTSGLGQDLFGALNRSFETISGGRSEAPAMAFVFSTIIDEYPGDWYYEAFEGHFGNIPVFGTLAIDDAITDFTRLVSIHGDQAFMTETCYLLLYGDLSPRFFITSIPDGSVTAHLGEITKANNNVIVEIDGAPTADFFSKNGFADGGVMREGVDFIPFIISRKGSELESMPITRALIGLNPDGTATSRGLVYEGATIAVVSNSGAELLDLAAEMAETVNKEENIGALLLFSCIVRRMAMGESLSEAVNIRNLLRHDIPFMFAHSGGEICPVSLQGESENRFHNYALIACAI